MQTDGILYVAPDVRYLIGELHDAPLPRVRLILSADGELIEIYVFLTRTQTVFVHFSAVRNYAVAHGVGEVKRTLNAVIVLQKLYFVHEAQSVFFVKKALAQIFARQSVKLSLSLMTERRVTEVMTHCNGACKLHRQTEIF